jgi:hypothetical protein
MVAIVLSGELCSTRRLFERDTSNVYANKFPWRMQTLRFAMAPSGQRVSPGRTIVSNRDTRGPIRKARIVRRSSGSAMTASRGPWYRTCICCPGSSLRIVEWPSAPSIGLSHDHFENTRQRTQRGSGDENVLGVLSSYLLQGLPVAWPAQHDRCPSTGYAFST